MADHAEMTFLHLEITTGLTFARIAMCARNKEKALRNARHARTAYETAKSYVDGLPADTPGLEELCKQMAELKDLLSRLRG